jgi:hypothetical protein
MSTTLKLITLALLMGFSLNCSCLASTTADNFAGADAVFEGKVTQILEIPNVLQYSVKLQVTQTFKGAAATSLDIFTATNSAACGVNFEKDKTYLVFAKKDNNGSLQVNLCSRTGETNAGTLQELLVLSVGTNNSGRGEFIKLSGLLWILMVLLY